MKRFAVTLAVVGMVMVFATFAVGFYAWAPYASWGGGGRLRFIEQRLRRRLRQQLEQWLLAGKLFKQRHDLRWLLAPAYACMPASGSTQRLRLRRRLWLIQQQWLQLRWLWLIQQRLQLRRLWLIQQQWWLLACEQLFQRLVLRVKLIPLGIT